jgi:hypothetical protein
VCEREREREREREGREKEREREGERRESKERHIDIYEIVNRVDRQKEKRKSEKE